MPTNPKARLGCCPEGSCVDEAVIRAPLDAEIKRLEKLATEQGQEIAITRERDERLEAEIERLRVDSVDKARAWDEIAKKNTIIEKLRAALVRAKSDLEEVHYNHTDCKFAMARIDCALEQKAGESNAS